MMIRCRLPFQYLNRIEALFNEDEMFKVLALYMKLFIMAFGKLKQQLVRPINENEEALNDRLDQHRQAILGSLDSFHQYMDYHRRQAHLSCSFGEMTNILQVCPAV